MLNFTFAVFCIAMKIIVFVLLGFPKNQVKEYIWIHGANYIVPYVYRSHEEIQSRQMILFVDTA